MATKEFYWVTDGQGRQYALAEATGYWDAELDPDNWPGFQQAGGITDATGYKAGRDQGSSVPGVSYFRNRIYDQQSGQWTQEDPLGLAGGINLYQYAGGNPVAFTDPFGMRPVGVCPPCDPPGGPPPVPVPGGDQNNSWKWNLDPNNSRGGTWGPKNPVEGRSQPSASQESANGKTVEHWDVDDGLGNRSRYDPEGRPLTPEEAHARTGKPRDPEPLVPPRTGLRRLLRLFMGPTTFPLIICVTCTEFGRHLDAQQAQPPTS